MKVKTFLLSSAAVLTVVGGAQAADLTIAEPVEYVLVCEAYGTGYWYIPGTQTCIKIGGEVSFTINFHSLSSIYKDTYGTVINGGSSFFGTNHSANWDFVTGAKIRLTGKSETEHGTLPGHVQITAESSNAQQQVTDNYNEPGGVDNIITHSQLDVDRIFKIDEAWLELGMVSAGYRASTFDYSGGPVGSPYRSDKKTDQLRLTWAMSGFGLMLAVEDPRDRWGTSLGWQVTMPDIIAAITAKGGNWDGKLSAGFAQIGNGGFPYGNYGVWGVNGGAAFTFGSGTKLTLNGAVGTGASFVGGGSNGFTNVSAFIGLSHPLGSTLKGNAMFSYLWDGDPLDSDKWRAAASLVWGPVTDFSVETRITYEQSAGGGDEVWTGRVKLVRKIDD